MGGWTEAFLENGAPDGAGIEITLDDVDPEIKAAHMQANQFQDLPYQQKPEWPEKGPDLGYTVIMQDGRIQTGITREGTLNLIKSYLKEMKKK